MQSLLGWFKTHPWLTAIAVAAYTFTCAVNHDRIQDLVRELQKLVGYGTLQRTWLVLGITVLAAISYLLIRRIRQNPDLQLLPIYWVGTAAGIIAAVHFFSVNNNEFIHFAQYALLACPVFALSGRFGETVAWTSWLGAFDESWQYGMLHPGWGIPLDFNDIVMNLFGAGLMVTLLVATVPVQKASPPKWPPFGPAYRFTAAVLGVGTVLWLAGKIALTGPTGPPGTWILLSRLEPKPFWFFDASWGPKTFHLLHPLEGMLLCVLFVYLYATLDRRWRWAS